MSTSPNPTLHIQKPRVYRGFTTDDQFKECLSRVVTAGGCSADELSKKVFPNQEVTVEQYLRRHLPYTVYLLDVAKEYAPLPADVVGVLSNAAKELLDDGALRRNYGRLFKTHHAHHGEKEDKEEHDGHGRHHPAPAIVRPLEVLDRGTWFVEPNGLGVHVQFGGKSVDVPYTPPAMGDNSAAEFFIDGELHYVPFMRVERTPSAEKHQPAKGHDVVKVSTEENPLWGQTYVRVVADRSEHFTPGGNSFRRLEVLRLLARNNHFKDSRRHFQAPAYSYVDHGNGYLLLHPPLDPDSHTPHYLGEGACTLSQFVACRPRWWTVLGKEEKLSNVFGWITCLASTVSLFHSLKLSHGRLSSNKVVLVHDGKNTTVFITDWHVRPEEGRHRIPVDSMQKLKSSMTPSGRTNANTAAGSSASEGETSQAEKSRQQDVKDLGEVIGDLLLLLLGTSREALTRQRKERINWANEVKSRDGFLKNLVENEDDQNRGFYPPLPVPTSPVTVVDNTTGKDIPPVAAEGSPAGSTTPTGTSEAKTDISERRQSRPILREQPGKLFSSVFSKRSSVITDSSPAASSNSAANAAAQAAAELQDRAKLVQQQLNTMLPFTIGKSGPQFAVSWWVEELRLMYPPVVSPTSGGGAETPAATPAAATTTEENKEGNKEGEEEAPAAAAKTHHRSRSSQESERQTLKTAEFLGNKLLPLLATMVSSEPSLRPKSREVWRTLSNICEDYYGDDGSCCCRCSHKGGSEEEVIWDEVAETVLRDLYERGIADEEEESWEGLGSNAAVGKYGWRRIGRVGEGVAGECLLD